MRKIIPFRDVREVKDKEGALLFRVSFENEDYLEQVKGVNVYYDYDSFLSNYQADLEQSGLPERRFLQHLSRAYEKAVSEIKYCVNYVYGQEITYSPNTHKKSNFTAEQLERIDDSLWVNGEMEAPILVTPNKKRIKTRLQVAFEDILNEIKEKSANISKSASEDDAQSLPPNPKKTKANILKEQLSQYGFFELEKVKTLSEQSKVSIIEKIAESGLPYAIAMFDYLGFIQYLEANHFDTKYKLNIEVSKWFNSDKEGRAVKGNISSLLKNSTENKNRYTAYKHKENVIKDYELLK